MMRTRLTDTLTSDAQARAAAAVAALLLGVLIGLVVLIVAGASHAAQATPPIIVEATPTAPPVASHLLTHAISAYGAPDTATLIGPVEAGRAYAALAMTPDGAWLQLDVAGSGLVWTVAASVDGVDAGALAIIAPPAPTAIPVPPPVAQQAPAQQQQTIYVVAPEAAPPTADLCTPETCDPAMAPTVCAANACWSAAAPSVVYLPAPQNQADTTDPQPGDPGFAASFRDPEDLAFAASFRDPGCSQFIGYLPGDPCYGKAVAP